MSKIKIGFVIPKYKGIQTKFTNGLEQNTYYLVALFRSIAEYEISYVLVSDNCLEESLKNQRELQDDTPLVELNSLDPTLEEPVIYDVLIHIESYLPEHFIKAIRSRFPTKFVTFFAGNTMWGFMEAIIHNRNASAIPTYESGIMDELWTSPHYFYQKTFLETLTKSPVMIIPYLYEPWFLQKLENSRKEQNSNFSSYYCTSTRKNIGILEPNISVTKNAVIPACIIEQLYCINKELFEERAVLIYGADHLVKHRSFQRLFGYFKSKSLFTANPRFTIVDILHYNCDFIISHQHSNELNYLYLDALYYNIPLIHNSDMLKDYGYYYPDFDIRKGAQALKNALENHNSYIEAYDSSAKKALYQFSTRNQQNIDGYKNLIRSLLAK
ncbi:DUF2827 family protein [[Limnothrix rosea] IAM M-220]|uniref:DUF2827 family protein n=1 Tax=[Limnothrix rosea] IAM M-220 TaxID=454133 RepID=UPI0009629CE5|nr:DUF2827 family protein [[Limnothrix rosea] IAM M-220]OKH19074.1 hypothetical protein NIES208_03650 [[Limnothrix rosea] IAM M-220]